MNILYFQPLSQLKILSLVSFEVVAVVLHRKQDKETSSRVNSL